MNSASNTSVSQSQSDGRFLASPCLGYKAVLSMGLGKPFKYLLKIFEWFRVQGVKYSAKCCLADFSFISSLLL